MSIQSYLLLGDQKAEFRHYLVLLDGFIVLLDRIEADLLVILLKSSDVLPSLGELSLLHALADVPGNYQVTDKNVRDQQNNSNTIIISILPVDKSPFGVHQVKLVIEPSPGLRYCCRVAG